MIRSLLIFALAFAAWRPAQAADLEGTWQGTLSAGGGQLRLVLKVSRASDGLYSGTLDSVDQGAVIPIDAIKVKGDAVRLELNTVHGTFEGTMNAEGTLLKGTWTQGGPLPLEFTRTAKAGETAKALEPAGFPLGLPLELEVPSAPVPSKAADGKTILVYELHITNFSGREILLKRLEVFGGDSPLAAYEGSALNTVLTLIGGSEATDKRTIPAGRRAVAFLWIALDAGAPVPGSLRHRITVGEQTVESSVAVSTARPVVLGPPLRGSNWLALNGPSNASIHRRAILPVDGKAHIAQRFAIDWVQTGSAGTTFTGDPKDNKNYHAYGSEVLAVADAVVTTVKDGIPQNVPGINSRAVTMTLETLAGNHVILDLGGGRFAMYAHLQPGSLRVKTGDKVRRGQVLGLLGNSGNSTEPHLHFQVSDANSALGSEGLPYALDSFEVLSRTGTGPQRNAMPLQNQLVRFGQ